MDLRLATLKAVAFYLLHNASTLNLLQCFFFCAIFSLLTFHTLTR
jgi:hypothetical protein